MTNRQVLCKFILEEYGKAGNLESTGSHLVSYGKTIANWCRIPVGANYVEKIKIDILKLDEKQQKHFDLLIAVLHQYNMTGVLWNEETDYIHPTIQEKKLSEVM
jgi:hypothetical protein